MSRNCLKLEKANYVFYEFISSFHILPIMRTACPLHVKAQLDDINSWERIRESCAPPFQTHHFLHCFYSCLNLHYGHFMSLRLLRWFYFDVLTLALEFLTTVLFNASQFPLQKNVFYMSITHWSSLGLCYELSLVSCPTFPFLL